MGRRGGARSRRPALVPAAARRVAPRNARAAEPSGRRAHDDQPGLGRRRERRRLRAAQRGAGRPDADAGPAHPHVVRDRSRRALRRLHLAGAAVRRLGHATVRHDHRVRRRGAREPSAPPAWSPAGCRSCSPTTSCPRCTAPRHPTSPPSATSAAPATTAGGSSRVAGSAATTQRATGSGHRRRWLHDDVRLRRQPDLPRDRD